MPTNVPLPALGESVTEGTISRWLKAVGDTVEADEALVEISTDKVDTEIPSPVAGTVLEIKFEEDDVAEVGAILAVIGEPGESAGGDKPAQAAPDAEEAQEEEAAEEQAAPADPSAEEKQPAAQPASGGGAASGTEVTLPALGESVTEGTISRWLKEVGDTVEADEAIVEISTDKVDTEIPSPVAGTLLEIKFNEDDVAEVGAVIAIIGDANAAPAQQEEAPAAPAQAEPKQEEKPSELDETAASVPAEGAASAKEEENSEKAAPAPTADPSPATEGKRGDDAAPRRAAEAPDNGYVTPLVRKLAGQHGIDLNTVKGSGVGGRIRKQDVLAAAEAAKAPKQEAPKQDAPAPAAAAPAASAPKAAPAGESKRGTTEKISKLRSIIAKRMVESLQTGAQLTATVEVDLTNISKIRAKAKDAFKAREGASLSYLPFITKAAIEALKQFPNANASLDLEAGTISYPDGQHIGIAVDTERGLLVPVVKDAGDLNVTGLAKKIADLAARTRVNKVTPDELSGATFTVTNYGSTGTLFDTPIINMPNAGILGTGAIVKRPVVVKDDELGDVIAIRDMMYLSLTYDHRVFDGADAGRFLSFVKARLEEGDFGAEFGA